MDKLFFIAGLPRSGSTLLCNILMQNPRFHASATSGLSDLVIGVRDGWDNIAAHRALLDNQQEQLKNTLSGFMAGYYAHVDRPVVFDKSRQWPVLMETIDRVLPYDAKMIMTVRDVRDVLASFEILHRKNSAFGKTGMARQFPMESLTVEGRMDVLLRPDQAVGSAWTAVNDAVMRGWSNSIHFVRFADLTTRPLETMRMLYAFLGEDAFDHRFDMVEHVTEAEDDRAYGIRHLHAVRPKVSPISSQWESVLGPSAQKYDNLNFWDIKR